MLLHRTTHLYTMAEGWVGMMLASLPIEGGLFATPEYPQGGLNDHIQTVIAKTSAAPKKVNLWHIGRSSSLEKYINT